MSSADERIINRLQKIYDAQGAGSTSFESITGEPTDNAALGAALATKQTEAQVQALIDVRGITQNSKSANYTLVLGDAQKHILHPVADDNARTFTIDSNANVPYPTGTMITFVNEINILTISITADTMLLAGGVLTGNRTLAAGGIATALKIHSDYWIINGTGLT